jgi:hypothetical protein
MIYLVAAYLAAVLILGGFLALSLNHLRELSKQGPPKSR